MEHFLMDFQVLIMELGDRGIIRQIMYEKDRSGACYRYLTWESDLYQKKVCVTTNCTEGLSSYRSYDQFGDQKPDNTKSEALQRIE